MLARCQDAADESLRLPHSDPQRKAHRQSRGSRTAGQGIGEPVRSRSREGHGERLRGVTERTNQVALSTFWLAGGFLRL